MGTVEVLITRGEMFAEIGWDDVSALDPRVRVCVVSPAQSRYLHHPGDGSDPAERALNDLLARAEVIFASYEPVANLARRAPALRWYHTIAAGIDFYVRTNAIPPGVLFTDGSGPTAIPISEYVLMAMLMLAKQAPGYVRLQQEHRWQRLEGIELRGKTVGIVGLGQIGSEVARLARAVGCRVIGMRRSASEPRANTDGVDLLLPTRDLPRLLAESDFVVIAAPATPETEALIGAAALTQMKPSASLINIARGSLVDEQALIAALKVGRIASAALDVFVQEPLTATSELWDLPQVMITPHHSTAGEYTRQRQADLFKENLRRYLKGEPLLNVVDLQRGY